MSHHFFLSGPKCCVGCNERRDVRIGIQIDQSEQGTRLHGKSTQQTTSNTILHNSICSLFPTELEVVKMIYLRRQNTKVPKFGPNTHGPFAF